MAGGRCRNDPKGREHTDLSESPTKNELVKSVEPDSSQLNADDLASGPITVTISGVWRGNKDQPIQVALVGHDRVYRPCKSMRRILIASFSDEPKKWVGQRMTLFCDPEVLWAGVKVGGIRISHLSGISEPRVFMLTKSRGKREEVTIRPIATPTSEEQKYISDATEELATASSLDVLKGYGQILKAKSQIVQDALRPVYAKRLDELKRNQPVDKGDVENE